MTMNITEVPATATLVIMKQDRSLACDPFLANTEEATWIRLGFSNYAFCLNTADVQWGTRITLAKFADAIEAVVDCSANYVNRAVVAAMRSVHVRMQEAEAQGRMLQLP